MATNVRTRRDVWKLADWDPILLWYANAIIEMQRRPLDDPTSWRYQAAIHQYIVGSDPLGSPSDRLPSTADRQRFWSQCQHNSWYFLPWHRIYLAYFEQIVAATVAELGGPDDWALPYWNYSDVANPKARRLPAAFRQPQMPDGRPNPLWIAERNPVSNTDADTAIDLQVDLGSCLNQQFFTGHASGIPPGFGGPRTGFSHSGGSVGEVERLPHGSMHVAVGGLRFQNGQVVWAGWMSRFNTAALDPIFWLHHCNIDRLWVVWRERDPLHVDPVDAQWLTSLDFSFHDAAGSIVTHTPSEVVETTTTPPLTYQYEDTSDPLAAPLDAGDAGFEPARRIAMNQDQDATPEMVGATEEPVRLSGRQATAHLAVSAPSGPAARLAEDADAPRGGVYLNVENITGSGAPTSYAVYLNVPPGDDPATHRELYAGLLPMFGVTESSQEDGEHAGSGLNYALEVGEVIRTLEASGAWNPDDLEVTFVPVGAGVEVEGARVAEVDTIEVGRVSLYYT